MSRTKNSSKIFIISGPSGAGEDSIIEGLRKYISFEKVITTTTREIRPGESQGDPYYFISRDEFIERRDRNEFAEWAEEDRGNFYGVSKKELERIIDSNKIVIWKIDYKGVIAGKKLYPSAIAILIDVPLEVIEERIRRRDNIGEEYVKERLAYAAGWYENRDKFDYSIKNEEGKIEEAIKEIIKIIKDNS